MKATRDAFGKHLPIMGKKHKNIVALDADLGKATKIASFGETHPDRFFQMGIAEANMIGVASGLSEYDYKVFLASFGSFLTGRYDQIRCSLAYPNRPVVLVGTHVGMAIGKDGVTQMGLEDVSIMRALPNMVVLNPASYSETIKIIDYLCETELSSPHYIRLGRQPVEDIDIPFEYGRGQVVLDSSDGEFVDCTIISTGCILGDVLKVAQNIQQNSEYSVRVVNMPTIKPMDSDMVITCAEFSDFMVTVEDHTIIGGLGSAVSDVLSENLPTDLLRIGLPNVFPESAPPDDLYDKYGLSVEKMTKQVIDALVDR